MAPRPITIGGNAASLRRLGVRAPKRTILKRPRPKAPNKLVPVKPKPVAVTPKPVTPPTPKPPNFNDWYKTDPRFLLQNPQFGAQRAGLYAQYGWQPTMDASGKVTGYSQSSRADNPFGITSQLADALAGRSQNVQDSANSRGLLFSGAQVQGQQNAATEYEGQLSNAQKAFQAALAGVNTDEAELISSLYPDYLAQAPPASAAAAAAAAAAKPSAAAAAAAAAAEADRKARVKKAQDHLRQDKIDAAARRRKRPTKKKPAPKKSTIGSNANSLRGI